MNELSCAKSARGNSAGTTNSDSIDEFVYAANGLHENIDDADVLVDDFASVVGCIHHRIERINTAGILNALQVVINFRLDLQSSGRIIEIEYVVSKNLFDVVLDGDKQIANVQVVEGGTNALVARLVRINHRAYATLAHDRVDSERLKQRAIFVGEIEFDADQIDIRDQAALRSSYERKRVTIDELLDEEV